MSILGAMAVCAAGTTVVVGLLRTVSDLFTTSNSRKHEAWTWKERLKSFSWNMVSMPISILKIPWHVIVADLGWDANLRRSDWYYRILTVALVGIIAWFKPMCLATAMLFYSCIGLYMWFKTWETDYHDYYRNVVHEFVKAESSVKWEESVPSKEAGA